MICLIVLFNVHTVFAEKELPLPEGKNIREWESISAALVSEERFSEAVVYLDKILEAEPNNLKVLSNKAGLLIKLEKFSESVELSNRVLVEEPNKISTLTNKAIALKMLKEYEESFLIFSKILSIEPDNKIVNKARANLLSQTPTISTMNSQYEVHILISVRDEDGKLIAVTESTNARFLPSLFTEKWWERLDEKGMISQNKKTEIFQISNKMIPSDDFLGMVTLERQMSGYDINIFEAFMPMIEVEKTDTAMVQWTIIKK